MKNRIFKRHKNWLLLIKKKAKDITENIGALYLANKRRDVPIYARVVSIIVVAYALSPVDLIPDFIPVLGYLDDLILIPLGITLATKLIPCNIMNECKLQAKEVYNKIKSKNWFAGGIILFVWALIIILILKKII